MPFQIVHQDITKMNTDAIVNAANSALEMGGGVCGAIFQAAGADKLQKACRKIGVCPRGRAVITPGFDLSAKYVIHAVGPVWQGGDSGERELLAGAYRSALMLAVEYGLKSIAFPLISSGIYGYPKAEALQVAVGVFAEFLAEREMEIYLAVFDRRAVELSEKLFMGVQHYIDTYYEPENRRRRLETEQDFFGESVCLSEVPATVPSGPVPTAAPSRPVPTANKHRMSSKASSVLVRTNAEKIAPVVSEFLTRTRAKDRKLEDVVKNLDETFSEMVLRLIDEKGKKDSEVYKKANIDRKLFSKIRSNPNYNPKKATAFALAIGLELSLDETVDLLAKAGYSFSPSSKFDVIVRYFIEQGKYDMFEINEALFYFEQPLLGA